MPSRELDGRLAGVQKRRKHFRRKQRYADAFRAAGYDTLADSLSACETTESLVGCTHCGKSWWVLTRCRQRVCPLCSYRTSQARGDYLLAMTKHMQHPKLLTLTMPLWRGDPGEGIDALRAHIRTIRKTKVFKPVVGGAYQIELKRKEGGWHIHVHMLLDAPFMPYKQIFATWRQILGHKAPQVDIRSAPTEEARKYVCKYPSKSASFDTNPDDIVAWYEATKGKRLFATFGAWYNAKIEELDPTQERPQPEFPCRFCGHVGGIFYARDGPFIFGGELWDKVAHNFTQGGAIARNLDDVQALIADAPRVPEARPLTNQGTREEDHGPI